MMAPSSLLLFIVLMTVLISAGGSGVERSVARSLTEYWPAWVVLRSDRWPWTSVGDSRTRPCTATPPLPTPGQLLEFISLSWTQTFVPLGFGVDPWLFSAHGVRVAFGVRR